MNLSARGAIRILLIEDNEGDAFLLEEMLAEIPASALTLSHAVSMKEAMEKLANQPFDLVLLDLTLPGFSDLEAVEKLRHECPEMAIIVMTGLADERKIASAMQKGVRDYLIKGRYDFERLLEAIERSA